jgi:hypothetical protein
MSGDYFQFRYQGLPGLGINDVDDVFGKKPELMGEGGAFDRDQQNAGPDGGGLGMGRNQRIQLRIPDVFNPGKISAGFFAAVFQNRRKDILYMGVFGICRSAGRHGGLSEN